MKTKGFNILVMLCLALGLYSCGGNKRADTTNIDETTLVAPSGEKIFTSIDKLSDRIEKEIVEAHGEKKNFKVLEIQYLPGFEKGYFAIVHYQVEGVDYAENFAISNDTESKE